MLKRIFALIIVMACLISAACAETTMFVNNPNPADRLHLRKTPNRDSESLGKYYNGTNVTVLRSQGDWSEVNIGMGNAQQTGWMMTKYLSMTRPDEAMPKYASAAKVTAYYQPVKNNKTLSIAAGRMISFMGLIEKSGGNWYHVMVHTGGSEGPYYAFLPAEDSLQVKALGPGHGVKVYISNPDKDDRLHLRTKPSTESKSLGKYYNGCECIMVGFTEEGEWIKVEMYGRSGWMKSDFLTIEGQRNNTYYGIPTVQTTSALTPVYAKADMALDNYEAKIDRGTKMEVLGLIGDDMLHVRLESGGLWYVYTADTDFTDSKKTYFKTNR